MDSDLDTLNFFANTEIQFGGDDEGGGSSFMIIIVVVVVIVILAGAYFTFIKSKTLAETSSSETKTNKPIESSTLAGNKSPDTSSGTKPVVPMASDAKVVTPTNTTSGTSSPTNTPTGPASPTNTPTGPASPTNTPTGPASPTNPVTPKNPPTDPAPKDSKPPGLTPEQQKKKDYDEFQKKKALLQEAADAEAYVVAEEEAKIQKKLKTDIKICGKDRIEPCNKGFLPKEFKDPTSDDKSTCCIIDPSRNDPEKIKEALAYASSMLKAISDKDKMTIETRVAKIILNGNEKYNPKSLSDTISRLANNLSKKHESKATAESEQISSAQVNSNSIEKDLIKNLTDASKQIEKDYGGAIGAKVANQSSNSNQGAMNPLAWAGMAFDAFQSILNMGDPGGYQNVTFLDQYIKIRDKTNETWNNEMKKNNIPTPVVMSPLSKMPPGSAEDPVTESDKANTIRELGKYILKEYIINYVHQVLDKIDLTKYSSAEQYAIIAEQVKNASAFFDTTDGKLYFQTRMCVLADGIMVDGTCTYKDRASCDASYDWNDIKNNKETKQNYVEYREGKCILVSPTLRQSCEDNKMEYDYEKQLCKITDEYCKVHGISTVDTPNGKDCKLEMGQSIAEKIFGTTIVRGLVQVFDPSQYKPCKSDEKDGNNLPSELKTAIYASIALPPPLSIPGIMYATLGNKTCINTAGCIAPKQNEAGLCYDKCKDGFKSDGATFCYKEYPEFQNNGMGHTVTSVTKKIVTNTGRPLSYCDPNSKEKGGALCYPKCKDGFSSDGATQCYKNPPPNWPGTTTLTHLQHKTIYSGPGKPLTHCNPDQDKGGALCYPKCRDGYKSDGVAICYGTCPAGSVDVGALCRDGCRAGYHDVAGVCWEDTPAGSVDVGALIRDGCRAGFRDVAGVCWGSCPGGWNDDGATCRENIGWNGCCNKGAYGECLGCATGGTVRGKESYVPATRARQSYVPATNAKPSYGRGAGEPLKCAPGLEQRGALCYDNCAANNANGIEFERRNDNIDMCSTKCPPGFTNIGIGGCQKEAYNRGAGEPMSCQPNELEKSKGLCYDKCADGYQDQSLGLCSQSCPPGSKDFGVGCTREAYNRGAGLLPFSIYVKERLVPYGKKDG